MDMVRHEYVGMYRALMAVRCHAQELQVKMSIAVGVETRAAVVPTLQDVQRNAR